jgi:hypothetical protein
METYGLTTQELRVLKKLNTPAKIQDFLNSIPSNAEETCYSPRMVLKMGKAQCMEGAMLAALALRLHGQKPLVVDLVSTKDDVDHVMAVFQQHGHWGAITKTNHPVLRYREPIYKNIRELVMSYFHEYFLDSGKKTLRTYSRPFDLSKFDTRGWVTAEEDIWYIPDELDNSPHYNILTPGMIRTLRKADNIEIEATKATEW